MLNQKDMALLRGLIKILNDGTFPLKAREVSAFAKIYKWVESMPDTMDSKPESKKSDK